jgi:hypothetical protein
MTAIHPSWQKAGGVALEIMEGKHDDSLDTIAQACRVRMKDRFRPGQTVKLVGTRNPEYEGKTAIIGKVNSKTVTVGIGGRPKTSKELERMTLEQMSEYLDSVTELNVPPAMLEVVA